MKKRRLLVFPVYVLLLGLLGCAMSVKQDDSLERLKRALDSRIGHHISSVIQTAGPPTQITDDEAGGQIYIWVLHDQKIVRRPYTVDSSRQQTLTSKQTTTSGQARWNSLFNRWEYKSETRTTYPEKSFSDRLLEMQRKTKYRTETVTTTTRMMFYTRADGTIYHWLVIEPNLTYAYNNPGNAQKDHRDYSNRENGKPAAYDYDNGSLAKKEKRQYANRIRELDTKIYLFPDDAKAYFQRGYAKYKLDRTHDAELDLRTALRLAIQKGDVSLKYSIEDTLRELQ